MKPFILDDIPFKINRSALMKACGVKDDSKYADELDRLANQALALTRPKALYKAVDFEAAGDDQVVINGISLKSHILKIKLEKVYRVFPLVATCGTEVDDWARSIKDTIQRYWAEVIKGQALRSAVTFLTSHLTEKYSLGKTAMMTPGSLPDWPIEEQRPLFTILGDMEDSIGVRLTQGLTMIPSHTISGILFPTEVSFTSCQLCERANCPGRRASYTGKIE